MRSGSSPSRCTRTVRFRPPVGLAAILLLSAAAASAGELDQLRDVVDTACSCAAAQASGMDAALRCTDGPRAFGAIKVASRGAWDDGERSEAAVLERVIETCIANALDHATARARLGLAARPGPPGAATMVWTQIRVADLAEHPATLARIHRHSGAAVKGMVASVGTDAVVLRRARRDGGGSEAIPLDEIREAWIMRLP